MLGLAAPAAARPVVVRAHKGLPGEWPGLALLSKDIEAASFIELAPFTHWMERQRVSGGADQLVVELASHLRAAGVDPRADIADRARSVLIGVASRFGPHSDAFTMVSVIAGGFDERALERQLSQAYAEVFRDGTRRVYSEASGSERRRAYAVIPGGLVIGPLPWVKEALERLSAGGEATRIATLVKSRVGKRRVGKFAWGAVSPAPETRRQLQPIKNFLGSVEGAMTMAAAADGRAKIGLRLDFQSPADAREARPFLQQILGLYSQLASTGLGGALSQVLSALSTSLSVDGSAVVADIVK